MGSSRSTIGSSSHSSLMETLSLDPSSLAVSEVRWFAAVDVLTCSCAIGEMLIFFYIFDAIGDAC